MKRAAPYEIFQALSHAMVHGAPRPDALSFTGDTTVSLQFGTGGQKSVIAWARELGLQPPELDSYIYDAGASRPWQVYSTIGAWLGWTVEVWTSVNEPNPADDFDMNPPELPLSGAYDDPAVQAAIHGEIA